MDPLTLGFAVVFIASVLMLIALAIVGLIAFYSIRRKEIGAEPAIRETKIAVILLLVVGTSIFFFAILLFQTDISRLIPISTVIIAAFIIIIIAFSIYWWIKTRRANKSELFQVPLKRNNQYLIIAIMMLFMGMIRVLFLLGNPNTINTVQVVYHLLSGLFFATMWFWPNWHITKEGIFWPFSFIKWEKIKDYEWQPKNDEEVILHLSGKWFGRSTILIPRQIIPIEYERPLKATIQKYAPQATNTSPQGII